MFLHLGPTGKVITGHVLDVSRTHLERKLQDYDRYLYLQWNPKKLNGWGCWEIRRRPEKLTAFPQGTHEGVTFVELFPYENDLVHHVLDVPYLNYQVLTKLQEIDAWRDTNWVNNLEYEEMQTRDRIERRNREEMLYSMNQNKRAIKDFKEAILSGTNPALLAKYWGSLT